MNDPTRIAQRLASRRRERRWQIGVSTRQGGGVQVAVLIDTERRYRSDLTLAQRLRVGHR